MQTTNSKSVIYLKSIFFMYAWRMFAVQYNFYLLSSHLQENLWMLSRFPVSWFQCGLSIIFQSSWLRLNFSSHGFKFIRYTCQLLVEFFFGRRSLWLRTLLLLSGASTIDLVAVMDSFLESLPLNLQVIDLYSSFGKWRASFQGLEQYTRMQYCNSSVVIYVLHKLQYFIFKARYVSDIPIVHIRF